jgi:hypothetical protein
MPRTTLAAALLVPLLALVGPADAKPKPPKGPRPFGPAFTVGPCSECETGIATLVGGTAAEAMAVWSSRAEFRVFRRLVDANGNLEEVAEIAGATSTQLAGVAPDGDGWLLGWFHPSQLFMQRIDARGQVRGDVVHVNAGRPPGVDDDSAHLAAAHGRVLYLWSRMTNDAAPDPVRARLFAIDGSPVGEEITLGDSFNRALPRGCVRRDGSAVAIWRHLDGPITSGTTPGGIALRRVGADGAPLGEPRLVAPPSVVQPFLGHELACAADGSFAVVWHTRQAPAVAGADVVWQRFTAAGVPRGPAQRLASTVAGDQLEPTLAFRPDGSALAVWESGEAGGAVLRARSFRANGRPVANDFVLAAPGGDSPPLRPSLALIPGTRRLAVSWWQSPRAWMQLFSE